MRYPVVVSVAELFSIKTDILEKLSHSKDNAFANFFWVLVCITSSLCCVYELWLQLFTFFFPTNSYAAHKNAIRFLCSCIIITHSMMLLPALHSTYVLNFCLFNFKIGNAALKDFTLPIEVIPFAIFITYLFTVSQLEFELVEVWHVTFVLYLYHHIMRVFSPVHYLTSCLPWSSWSNWILIIWVRSVHT